MGVASPSFTPPRPIQTLCIATPSLLAPPTFGRIIADLVFHLRAHGIECAEAKPGLSLHEAFYTHPHKTPDAILYIDGAVSTRVEDLLALVDAVRHGIDCAGILVPQANANPIDWARVRQAVKRRSTLDQVAASGLAYNVKFLLQGEQRQVSNRSFREIAGFTDNACIILHRGYFEMQEKDAAPFSHRTWLLEDAPASRTLGSGAVLACKEPEWMVSELVKRQKPLVDDGSWRKAKAFAITTVAFNDNVAEIFKPVATILREGLRALGFKAETTAKNEVNYNLETWPIILGAHIAATDVDIPEGAIFYCAEQPASDWVTFIKAEAELFRPAVIWSWAECTTKMLLEAGLPAVTVPLGFVEGLNGYSGVVVDTIPPIRMEQELHRVDDPDIDALFYGGMTERRRRILGQLSEKGLRVHYEKSCWGAKRQNLLSRSKVVLNIRGNEFGPEGGVFEAVRCLPLFAYGVVVVSEKGEGWERFKDCAIFGDSAEEIVKLTEQATNGLILPRAASGNVRMVRQEDFLRPLFLESV